LITRAEMAAMFGSAMNMKGISPTTSLFTDVSGNDWAAPMLTALKQAGWINGYPDNRFMPQQHASRAEFSALLYRAVA